LNSVDGHEPLGSESVLTALADLLTQTAHPAKPDEREALPGVEVRYRALTDQIPAVVFMAYLDQGMAEAYVSPQIERSLGFTQREWLEDPVRWYQQIHPEDKDRWSLEAAQMFLTGQALRSVYRVLSRDGRVIWFHCEAKIVRDHKGNPWFFHGSAFDITELKQTEAALAQERNVLSTILDTVDALVMLLDWEGHIVRFNRACEKTTGRLFAEVKGASLGDLLGPEETDRFQLAFDEIRRGVPVHYHEGSLYAKDGRKRLIRWSATMLPGPVDQPRLMIATGTDITEHNRLEQAVLEISNSEQRRIGQDLHDGLGQHLTGIAFLSKVLEQQMLQQALPEAAEVGKIVKLVNEGIRKTRELARGLVPVWKDSLGLMNSLSHWANEVEDLFGIACTFQCEPPVSIEDQNTSNHLYRIAQEAVHNAIKHGKSSKIVITLATSFNSVLLTIRDYGTGMPKERNYSGMGLDIMRYRAGMIGGALEIAHAEGGGTQVTCCFPRDKL
jgi:PAS domain S-box-containing protein